MASGNKGLKVLRAAPGGFATALAAVALVAFASPASLAAAPPNDRITDNLYGTAFASSHDGWAVGAFGAIFRTRDGGQSWRPQVSHTDEPLFAVDFADARNGWVVGRSGLILRTADGGDTWSKQTSGTENHLFSVDFIDTKFGCAVGDWGTVVLTQDGGVTWRAQQLPRDVILNGVSFVDHDHGWAVGEAGAVLASADGGATWKEQVSGVEKTLFGVHFTDRQQGWAVGIDGIILRTEDGGTTWQVQNGAVEVGALEQVGFVEAFENPTLYAVTVVNDEGIAVGEIGAIFHSRDGGRSWQREPTPKDWGVSWLRDVSVVAGTHGAIVGAGGRRVMVVESRIDLPREGTHATETPH